MENENFKTINGVQYHTSELHKFWNSKTHEYEYQLPETISLPNDNDCEFSMKHSLNSGTLPLILKNFNNKLDHRDKSKSEKTKKPTRIEHRIWVVRPTKILKNGKPKTLKTGYYYKSELKRKGYLI